MDTLTGLWQGLPSILPWTVPFHIPYEECQNQDKGLVWFHVQKWPVQESGGAFLEQEAHLDPNPDGQQGSRESMGGASTSTTE